VAAQRPWFFFGRGVNPPREPPPRLARRAPQARFTSLGGTWGAQGPQGGAQGGYLGVPRAPNALLSPPISWCSYMEHAPYGGLKPALLVELVHCSIYSR
jgi:hypothetical protein